MCTICSGVNLLVRIALVLPLVGDRDEALDASRCGSGKRGKTIALPREDIWSALRWGRSQQRTHRCATPSAPAPFGEDKRSLTEPTRTLATMRDAKLLRSRVA